MCSFFPFGLHILTTFCGWNATFNNSFFSSQLLWYVLSFYTSIFWREKGETQYFNLNSLMHDSYLILLLILPLLLIFALPAFKCTDLQVSFSTYIICVQNTACSELTLQQVLVLRCLFTFWTVEGNLNVCFRTCAEEWGKSTGNPLIKPAVI